MRRILLISFFVFFLSHTINAQFHLIVNEFSQGNGGTKEFVELLVIGTRTCTDSTADIRNWVFDDQNGWYGAASTGIAGGHYRFANNTNWQKVPYGSIILLYNNADQNGSIPSGVDDPTDANHDYVYIVPINNALLEQNSSIPTSPSSASFVYPTTGYSASGSWSSLGLSNSGDGVIVADPANLGVAHFSIIFGFTVGAGFQTPTVVKGNVAANKNCYLDDALYTNAASWIIGNAGTSDETPGAGNSPANIAWIQSMRLQVVTVPPTSSIIQPTCTVPTGTITVINPVGAAYTYSIDGINFQSSPVFPGLTPNTYTITVMAPGGCTSNDVFIINAASGSPAVPSTTIVQPTCTTPTGTITITNPVGATYTYSIDGINFQSSPVFPGLAPNNYTITVMGAGGCTSSDVFIINATPGSPAVPTATIIQPTCTVPTGTITVTNPVGATYTYSIDGINFQSGPIFPGLAPNNYTVTVMGTGGCTSSDVFVINVAPGSPAVPTATIIQPTCAVPTGTITVTNPVGATYTYSIDGINFQSSPVFPGLAPNNYTITVMGTGGCTSSDVFVINIAPGSPAVPTTTITQPTCTVPTGTITITNPVGTTFTYSIDGINFQSSPVFPGLAPNNYTITVMGTGGCTSSDVFVINVAPGSPAVPVTTIIQPTCTIPTGTITVTNPIGATYTYSIDGINFQSSPVFPGLAPNTYTITVMGAGGCTSSDIKVLNNVESFLLNLSASPNPAVQGSIISLNTGSASAYQVIAWLPQSTFPDQTTMSQSIAATANTTYFAVGQSLNGCIDTAQVTIAVTPKSNDIFVPNVFTPNNDGNNDELFVYGNSIKGIDFRIFNQWGESIFQATDKSKGWDGRYKGVMQPVAVYIYVLKAIMLDGSVITKKGSVTLVR